MMKSAPSCMSLLFVFFLAGCVQPLDYCAVPSDCTRLNLVHGACVGEWECTSNTCNWQCDQNVIEEQKKTIYDLDERIDDPFARDNQTLPPTQQERVFMSRAACLEYGGYWNECASTCRGDRAADFCISVCETICMCGTQEAFTCPPGYACREYDKETGEGECIAR